MILGATACHMSRNRLGNRVRVAAKRVVGIGKLGRSVRIDTAQTGRDAQDGGRGR